MNNEIDTLRAHILALTGEVNELRRRNSVLMSEISGRTMDMRDKFAMAALATINSPGGDEWRAAKAYRMADAMMKARSNES